MILTGQVLLILGIAGMALSRDWFPITIAAYWMSGLAVGAIYPPIIAWITGGDGTGRRRQSDVSRVLITFCLAWNLGMICGQLGGGFLFAFDSRSPLWVALSLAVVNVGLFLRAVEPAALVPVAEDAADPDAAKERSLSSAFARVGWVANLGGAFSIGLILHLFPHLAVSLDISSERHGIMLGIMRVAIVGVYLVMHSLSFWHHRFSVHLAVQAVALAGLWQLTRATTEAGLVLGLCALGCLLGFNYFASTFYSTTGSHDRKKGFFSGINEGVIALGIATGSLVGGLWGLHAGLRAPYLLGMVVLAVFIIAQCAMVRVIARQSRRVCPS